MGMLIRMFRWGSLILSWDEYSHLFMLLSDGTWLRCSQHFKERLIPRMERFYRTSGEYPTMKRVKITL